MSDDRDWVDDRDEVLAFADFLVATGRLTKASSTLYYFEKPWKWTTEYHAWVSRRRPEEM